MRPKRHSLRRGQPALAQRGFTTLFVVLILLAVMLLGALALARMTEAGTLAAGNASYRDASLHASHVGVNTAFQAIINMPVSNESLAVGNWYWPQGRPLDANGLPVVNWDSAPEVLVGAYSVRYVVERLCEAAVVSDPLRECLVKAVSVPSSARDGAEKLDSPSSPQYRATVRVIGPKNTTTFVQSLITKG